MAGHHARLLGEHLPQRFALVDTHHLLVPRVDRGLLPRFFSVTRALLHGVAAVSLHHARLQNLGRVRRRRVRLVVKLDSVPGVVPGAVPRQRRRARAEHLVRLLPQRRALVEALDDVRLHALRVHEERPVRRGLVRLLDAREVLSRAEHRGAERNAARAHAR